MFPSRRRRILVLSLVLAVAVLSALDHAGVFGHRGDDRAIFDGACGIVTAAVRGDTIDVDLPDDDRPATRLRLLGLACPAIAAGDGEADEYFAREALNFVRSAVIGRQVRLELDPLRAPRDRHGRLRAYVRFPDSGEMLNELLIERGLAYADGRFRHVHQERFAGLEKQALRKKAGLWAGVKPGQMPSWRRHVDSEAPP